MKKQLKVKTNVRAGAKPFTCAELYIGYDPATGAVGFRPGWKDTLETCLAANGSGRGYKVIGPENWSLYGIQ